MNVVDSSGWLEYFSDGLNAEYFSEPLSQVDQLIVPSISLFEVYKVVLRERSEEAALQAIALMKQGKEVSLNSSLAIQSARVSHQLKLPMADSIILTTARSFDSVLWTQDDDFEGLDGVQYFAKRN